MKLRFNIICDALFFSGITFIFIFAWARFYFRSISLAIVLSGVIFVFMCILLIYFLNKHNQKINLSKDEKNKAIELATRLNLLESNEVISYFFKACTKQENPIKTRYGIIFQNENMFVPIFSNIIFTPELFTKIVNFASQKNVKNIIICSQNIDYKIKLLAKNIALNCEFWDEFVLYSKKGRLLSPPICLLINPKPTKIRFNQLMRGTLVKARSKHYIIFGLVLLVFSLFIPFKLYYLIFGSIMLSLGVTVLLLKIKAI